MWPRWPRPELGDFRLFEKFFGRKIFNILEETSLPDLDVFTMPKLDKAIVDQVPFNLKKSVESGIKSYLKYRGMS